MQREKQDNTNKYMMKMIWVTVIVIVVVVIIIIVIINIIIIVGIIIIIIVIIIINIIFNTIILSLSTYWWKVREEGYPSDRFFMRARFVQGCIARTWSHVCHRNAVRLQHKSKKSNENKFSDKAQFAAGEKRCAIWDSDILLLHFLSSRHSAISDAIFHSEYYSYSHLCLPPQRFEM
jgi:glucan phosphoethanolaminetransferase (alkaline phosphatase superfamily)